MHVLRQSLKSLKTVGAIALPYILWRLFHIAKDVVHLFVRELSPINMALGVSPESRGHQEGFYCNSPLRIVGSIKNGNQGGGVVV